MSERDPLFVRTVISVCVAHIFLIIFCMYHFEEEPIVTSTKRMVVKTIALQQPVTSPIVMQPSLKKAKVISIKKDKPKENTKLQQAKMTLTALRTEKNTSVLQDLKNIAVRSNNDCDAIMGSYEDLLADMLAQELRLPEPGDVKIALTLDKTGAVRRLQIIESKNQRNQDAVEKRVKQMHFPPLSKDVGAKSEKTFTIIVKGKL